jgi:indolepyruvate ferredoxin oxidoreductase
VAYARKYTEFVQRVAQAETAAMAALRPGQTRLSEAVARYLFKLMAYKDEYEVARLSLKPEVGQAVRDQFGAAVKVSYYLHPPFLRALGMKRKLKLGSWFDNIHRLLVAMRRVRGTPFDLFGYTAVRRLERTLINEYRGLIEAALADLSPQRYERAVKLAQLPDLIRGYEEIKLENVARFREAVAELQGEPESSSELALVA